MARYHINKNGNPGLCKATAKPCPFGGAEKHYPSKEMAREHYEFVQAETAPESMSKNGTKPESKLTDAVYARYSRLMFELPDEKLATAEGAKLINDVYAEACRRDDEDMARTTFDKITLAFRDANKNQFRAIAPTLESLDWLSFQSMTSRWGKDKTNRFYGDIMGHVSDDTLKYWQRTRTKSAGKFKVPARAGGHEFIGTISHIRKD